MEILVVELSKLLQISVEKATELYPIIQEQFITYKILNTIMSVPIWIAIITGMILFFASIFWLVDFSQREYSRDLQILDKIIPIITVIFIISIIICTIIQVFMYKLSPDFMLIKEFL